MRASPYTLASRRAGLDTVPATGDWVAVTDDPDEGVAIVGVVPRWSAFARKDPDERVTVEQVLAANVDVFAVVCGLDRSLVQNRVERMLSVAWESGALPVVVLTKADLAADLAVVVREAREVAGVGVSVHVTSARSGEGIDELRALLLPTRTLGQGIVLGHLQVDQAGRDRQHPYDDDGGHQQYAAHRMIGTRLRLRGVIRRSGFGNQTNCLVVFHSEREPAL